MAGSSFKMPKEMKAMLSSVYSIENRSTIKRLFVEAADAYYGNKNRKFSDPASAQRSRSNKDNNTDS